MPDPTYQLTPTPPGCICPAGANRECENPGCPRKSRQPSTWASPLSGLAQPLAEPLSSEIRDALHWWQQQDVGSEEWANASSQLAALLRRLLKARGTP